MTRPARESWWQRADRLGRATETLLLSLLVAAMIGLAATQIALRNIWGTGLSWADEALRVMVLWVTMVGAVAASGERRHVNIDVAAHLIPAAWQPWIGRLTDTFAAGVCLVLAWASYRFVAGSIEVDDRAFAGQLPAWTLQAILPVGFLLLGCRYLASAGANPRGEPDRDPGSR